MSYTCDDCQKNMGGQPDYQENDRDPGRAGMIRHTCQECRVKERTCAQCEGKVHHLTVPHLDESVNPAVYRPEGDHYTYIEIATEEGRKTFHAECLSKAAAPRQTAKKS